MIFGPRPPWKDEAVSAIQELQIRSGKSNISRAHLLSRRYSRRILQPLSSDTEAGDSATAINSFVEFILICSKKLEELFTGTRPSIRSNCDGNNVFHRKESAPSCLPPTCRATTGVSWGILVSRGILIWKEEVLKGFMTSVWSTYLARPNLRLRVENSLLSFQALDNRCGSIVLILIFLQKHIEVLIISILA